MLTTHQSNLLKKWSGILDKDLFIKRGRYIIDPVVYPKIVIPTTRRTFPQLVASDLVGVQPMSGPVGHSFTLRGKYRTKHGRYIKDI